MTTAALALAMAVLAIPASSRRRARELMGPTWRHRELRMMPLAVIACAALPWLLPWTTTLGVGLLVATLVGRRRLGVRRQERIGEAAALQEALDVMVGELRIGAHPVAAIGVAAKESRGRVAEALSSVAARAVLGADVAAGLRAQAQRSTLPGHWERLAVCWHLAQTHGLAIATLMHAAQRDIVERERFQGRVAAGMAGARATAAILAGLPLLGILLGQLVGADPLRFLLSGGVGGWLLVLGSGLVCCGLLWSDRITSRVVT
ncbi:MAG: type II secretion system F family protein [Actinomycetia bacterium]|nr:type II secretion system F family protein [Actinomycetes bacterium]